MNLVMNQLEVFPLVLSAHPDKLLLEVQLLLMLLLEHGLLMVRPPNLHAPLVTIVLRA